MPLTFERKQALVQQLGQQLAAADVVIAADMRGMNAAGATELRARARAVGASMRIVPNRLGLRAVEGTKFECLRELFQGPTLLAWATGEPMPLASLFNDSAGGNFNLKGLTFGEEILPPEQVGKIAALPSRDQALAQLCGLLKAPISGLASSLHQVPRKLAFALAAVRDQKQEGNSAEHLTHNNKE